MNVGLHRVTTMFEEELLVGDSERRIRVETHLGTALDNVVAPPADQAARARYALVRRRYGGKWVSRKPATGVYNCYGMVFAARRTSLLDDERDTQVRRILEDDGYRLTTADDILPGDLVFYSSRKSGTVYHVAVITRVEALSGIGRALRGGRRRGTAPFALSKWGDSGGEDEHHVQHHCWLDQEMGVEYWTDRPAEEAENA